MQAKPGNSEESSVKAATRKPWQCYPEPAPFEPRTLEHGNEEKAGNKEDHEVGNAENRVGEEREAAAGHGWSWPGEGEGLPSEAEREYHGEMGKWGGPPTTEAMDEHAEGDGDNTQQVLLDTQLEGMDAMDVMTEGEIATRLPVVWAYKLI